MDFVAYTHPYITGTINDYRFNIIVDSGAQASVVSNRVVEVLKIEHLIDRSKQGVIKGVGQSNMIGLTMLDVKINNNIFLPVCASVIDTEDFLFLLGLDFLYSHDCKMDFKNRTMQIFDQEIKFLNELEIHNGRIPINVVQNSIKTNIVSIKNTCPNTLNILKKIIGNIISNPHSDKFKHINKNSKVLLDSKLLENNFLKNLGFVDHGDKLKFCGSLDTLLYTKHLLV